MSRRLLTRLLTRGEPVVGRVQGTPGLRHVFDRWSAGYAHTACDRPVLFSHVEECADGENADCMACMAKGAT